MQSAYLFAMGFDPNDRAYRCAEIRIPGIAPIRGHVVTLPRGAIISRASVTASHKILYDAFVDLYDKEGITIQGLLSRAAVNPLDVLNTIIAKPGWQSTYVVTELGLKYMKLLHLRLDDSVDIGSINEYVAQNHAAYNGIHVTCGRGKPVDLETVFSKWRDYPHFLPRIKVTFASEIPDRVKGRICAILGLGAA